MERNTRKALAAISSVIWSALLTLMKFIVGLMTGSLGILSEALHSGLDLLAAVGTLFAVRVSALPADDDHPYGHGKAENLMALAETLLLLLTAVWVVHEAVLRLWSDDPAALHVETSVWSFVVVVVSLAVDINRSRMLHRVAKETNSAALEADAAHFATDIWSSAAVLLGISGAALAEFTVEGTWLHAVLLRADVFASLVVALFILHVCYILGRKSVNSLMDKADSANGMLIRETMARRMPTYPLLKLRVREVGNKPYVDMVVQVPSDLHVDTAHEISEAIESLVSDTVPEAETIVHIQPAEHTPQTPEFIIRRIALTHRFGVHGLVLLNTEAGLVVTADLELPKDATLADWQVPVEAFRREVAHHLHAIRVFVHVEPSLRELPASEESLPTDWDDQVRAAMIRMGAPLPRRIECFELAGQRLCTVSIPMEKELTVEQSHARLTALTKRLSEELPPLARLMVTYC